MLVRGGMRFFVLLLGPITACAMSSEDPLSPPSGGGKADQLGPAIENACAIGLSVAIDRGEGEREVVHLDPAEAAGVELNPGDRIEIPDLAMDGYRTVAIASSATDWIHIGAAHCPWDVVVEEATIPSSRPDGASWDPSLGDLKNPDVRAAAFSRGCSGHALVEGTLTSTVGDTLNPRWSQEVLSWITWGDLEHSLTIDLEDEDIFHSDLIGSCSVELPGPAALEGEHQLECEDGGSVIIRFQPADDEVVPTRAHPQGGTCG